MMRVKIVIYSKPESVKLLIPILTQVSVTLKHAISLLSLSLLPILLLLESAAQERADSQCNGSKQAMPVLL